MIATSDQSVRPAFPAVDDEAVYTLVHVPGLAAILAARRLLRAALMGWDIQAHTVTSAAMAAMGWLVENVVLDLHIAGLSDAMEVSVRLGRREEHRIIRIEILDRISKQPYDLGWASRPTGLKTAGFNCHLEGSGRRTRLDIDATD